MKRRWKSIAAGFRIESRDWSATWPAVEKCGQYSGRGGRGVDGIEANVGRCEEYAEASPSNGTSLNPYIGYEMAGKVIKESVRTGKSIRQIVLAKKLMTAEELDRALDVESMTRGGIIH